MKRALVLLFGVLTYLFFIAVFLRAVWFVWTMDALPARSSAGRATMTDAALLIVFAVQHSGMARQGFKRLWTRLVPETMERTVYVLASSALLLAMIEFWQPISWTVWNTNWRPAQILLQVLFWAGWLYALISTVLISHFDLFGLRRVWSHWRNAPSEPPKFVTEGPYRAVRHPVYAGTLVAYWSTPRMTLGHLFFAAVFTAYIVLAIRWEERDMIARYGESYRAYRGQVSMLLPLPNKRKRAAEAGEAASDHVSSA